MDVLWILSCLLAFVSAAADHGCGSPAIAPLITESSRFGEEAVPHSWPWQVSFEKGKRSFEKGKRHFCGGILINENWVLTAAHCRVKPCFTRVIMGQHDRRSNTEDIQIMKVRKAFVHPFYDPYNINNDVQLIKLASPAKLGMHVYPVCLAETSDNFPGGMMCVGSGWGGLPDLPLPPALRQTSLPLLTNEQCKRLWGDLGDRIREQMICAGAAGASHCFGDSGGPLVCEKDGAWTLVGVASFAGKACDPTMPNGYARVSEMRSWIDRTIAAN